jgi:CheY-like chemotaxis protein
MKTFTMEKRGLSNRRDKDRDREKDKDNEKDRDRDRDKGKESSTKSMSTGLFCELDRSERPSRVNGNDNDNHNDIGVPARDKSERVEAAAAVTEKCTSFGRLFTYRSDKSKKGLGLRVLLCEDSVTAQKLVVKWLEKCGCTVTLAQNGKEGLHYMTTQEFDICLMDFLMVS